MPIELEAALIAALVALITAGVSSLLSWMQLRRERDKWLVEFKSTYSLELYKARLSSYAEVFKTIGKLSNYNRPTFSSAKEVANELNNWLYSNGGLCAGNNTRGAILGLRESCERWSKEESRPSDLYEWRNAALASARLDLDLQGLESYDFANPQSLLHQLQSDIQSLREAREKD
jgi:hypothetical protein